MGAGLGGGSSNAAAVLLALPALAGKPIPYPESGSFGRNRSAATFRFSCTAVQRLGLGRGTELYPLPDQPAALALIVVSTGVHVSTPEAYRALGTGDVTNALTSAAESPILREFQTIAWDLAGSIGGSVWINFR